MPLQTGEILSNRYRIIHLLRKGGFGTVYKAWDINLDRPRAVKESLELSPQAQRQFKLEAQILSDLTHPNLPKVIDHFMIPDQGQYLVMEFVEGQDLHELLEQRGTPFPEAQALGWIMQVCEALIYLHSQHPPVIHRDIKPANIKICPDGRAVLVDFGIAKVYDPSSATTLGARAITPGFSPIEQYSNTSRTDVRSDVYALGATLFCLLTGRAPAEAVERSAGTQLPALRQINPGISPHVEAAIIHSMAVQPDLRLPTIRDFQAALTGGPDKQYQPVTRTQVMPYQSAPTPQPAGSIPVITQPNPTQNSGRGMWLALGGMGTLILVMALVIASGLFYLLNRKPVPLTSVLAPSAGLATPVPIHQSRAATAPLPSSTSQPLLKPSDAPAVIQPSEPPTLPPTPVTSPTPSPRISDFYFCDRPCDEPGAVRRASFPEGTTRIYYAFRYEGMQPGMNYTRLWTNLGQEWVRYQCVWRGPESGVYYSKIWDTDGLRSGTWRVSLAIEDYGTFQATVEVSGKYDYWSPAGTRPCADW